MNHVIENYIEYKEDKMNIWNRLGKFIGALILVPILLAVLIPILVAAICLIIVMPFMVLIKPNVVKVKRKKCRKKKK